MKFLLPKTKYSWNSNLPFGSTSAKYPRSIFLALNLTGLGTHNGPFVHLKHGP